MDSPAFLPHLRRELTAFRACLDGDLSAPVTGCGAWTLRDLAGHLGRGNLWSAAAVTERRGDFRPGPAPDDRAALGPWFDETCAVLLDVLDADPSTEAWTFYPPHTVGFWQRRRCLETLVHRWDAEHALGSAGPLDPELAAEGVTEVFDTMAPRQIARGHARPPRSALRLEATDTGTSWTHGSGAPVATVAATAEHLLLMLWGRLPGDGAAFSWTGDRQAGRDMLAEPLVP